RGTEVTVEVNDGHFADEGDLCLFGLVLSEFYSLYATINSFVHLTIVTKPSEQRFRWQPARGSLPLL
ncbi:MAG TPA: type VI secretion system baseplate subunit TssF, partial [Bacteroidota bacterium]